MSMEELIKRIEDNDVDAMLQMQQMFFEGNGVEKNLDTAFELLKKIHEFSPENEVALKRLGDCFYNGYGVTQNIEQAIVYYKMALDLGCNESGFILGKIYYEKKDKENALLYFGTAAALGHDEAMKFADKIMNEKAGKKEETKDEQEKKKKPFNTFITVLTVTFLLGAVLFCTPQIMNFISNYKTIMSISVYKSTLVGFVNKESEEPRFALGYLDSDDIPELFVSLGDRDGCPVFVYTIKDKKPVELGNYGKYGKIDIASGQGMIRTNDFINDDSSQIEEGTTSFVSFENSIVNVSDIFKYNNKNKTYNLNEEDVKQEEFLDKLSDYDKYEFVEVSYQNMKLLNKEVIDSLKNEYKNYFLQENEEELKTGWEEKAFKQWKYYLEGESVTGIQEIGNKIYSFDKYGFRQVGWQTHDNKKYYFDDNGFALTGIQEIENKKYHFNDIGIMSTDYWHNSVNGKSYYKTDGTLAIGITSIKDNKYYFDEEGMMLSKCFVTDDKENKYYLSEDGTAVNGKVEIENDTYYFDDECVMCTGHVIHEGKCYYFLDGSGTMVKDYWLNENEKMSYYNEEGIRLEDDIYEVDGYKYYFDANGIMQTGKMVIRGNTYCFDEHGIMQTGWVTHQGERYYFKDTGVMVTGIWMVDGKNRVFGTNGMLIK